MTIQKKWVMAALLVLAMSVAVVLLRSKAKRKRTPQQPVVAADSVHRLWFKNSVIYTLDVEVFKDSDGDGTGDFNGLTARLGYIDSLGCDAIWLAPFQTSPGQDDGYDISDFYTVDKRLGTLADFKNFLAKAKSRHLRVIMDLVLNHTSIEHPWFKAAEASRTSPYRSWYVWSETRPANYNKGMVFPGVQKTIWSYDSVAGEYYYHRFYWFQPDLNMQHAAVKAEVKKIIKFWLSQGIDGFRLDGVPFMIEVPARHGDKFEHQYTLLNDMRTYVNSLNPEAIILGEANVTPEENKDFFGAHGEGMHMMFNFFVNQHLFYALATGNASPLKSALEKTKEIPKTAEWGQFLRNHDEVDLGRLSNGERNKVYDAFGPDKNMQLYDRGIRRRLAPMMNNNRKQLELAYSLLLALPSTPVLRYGDELGMGDDLRLKERLAVRTPMQWSNQPQGGFTTAAKPVRPVVDKPPYGYQTVNVKTEEHDALSLLQWTRKMVLLRSHSPEISYGVWKVLDTDSKHVLALVYTWKNKTLLTLHNLSDEPQTFSLDLHEYSTRWHDLIGDATLPSSDRASITLPPYGYRWMRGEGAPEHE
jgi:maltose alpha-D-glucosyltransferase/alpha-amylase